MESSKQLKGLISKADVILKGINEIEKNINKLGSGGDEKQLKQKILDNYKALTAQYTILLRDIDKNFAKLALIPDLHGPILETKYDDIPEILGTKLFDELTNKEKDAIEDLKLENLERLREQVTKHDKTCVDLEKNIQEFRKVMKTSYRSTPFSNVHLDSGVQLTKSVLTGNNLKVKPSAIPNQIKNELSQKPPQQPQRTPLPNRPESIPQPKDSLSAQPLAGDIYGTSGLSAINPAILGGGHSIPKPNPPPQNPIPTQNPSQMPNQPNPQARPYMHGMGVGMGQVPGMTGGLGQNAQGRVLQNPGISRGQPGFPSIGRGIAQNMAQMFSKSPIGTHPNPSNLPQRGGVPRGAANGGMYIPPNAGNIHRAGQLPPQPPQPHHQQQ